MARHLRIDIPGGWYHVMSRGTDRRMIFEGGRDCGHFLELIEEMTGRYAIRLHAYVLMGNHYHLLLETPEANLVKWMAWFLSTYTLRYNARHKQRGHVFQGRYKAVMIEPEEGGFTERVSTYIHLNPLRARMVRWPEEGLGSYPWSSYPTYAGEAELPGWLELEEKSAHDELAARRCLEKALERMGMTADEMRLLKKKDKRKLALGWWLRRHTCVDAGWISATLRMGHRTSVSKAVRQIENTRDPECSLWRQTFENIPRISD